MNVESIMEESCLYIAETCGFVFSLSECLRLFMPPLDSLSSSSRLFLWLNQTSIHMVTGLSQKSGHIFAFSLLNSHSQTHWAHPPFHLLTPSTVHPLLHLPPLCHPFSLLLSVFLFLLQQLWFLLWPPLSTPLLCHPTWEQMHQANRFQRSDL